MHTFSESDPSMRSEFLDLFRLMKRIRDEEDDDSSSDEKGYMSQYEAELSYVNEMCPRKAFFYGMAPRHNEAVIALMRLFVGKLAWIVKRYSCKILKLCI